MPPAIEMNQDEEPLATRGGDHGGDAFREDTRLTTRWLRGVWSGARKESHTAQKVATERCRDSEFWSTNRLR